MFSDYLNTVYKSNTVKNVENTISCTKSNQTLVNNKPNRKIKFDTPNAISPIEYQQT